MSSRKSLRLRDYDYSQTGMYFVTVCAQNRQYLFGDIVGEKMILNDAGRMVQTVWGEIPDYYSGVEIDTFTIMPNHIHGILALVGAVPCCYPSSVISNDTSTRTKHVLQAGKGWEQWLAPRKTLSLPDVVHRFKTMTTKQYAAGVKKYGWPEFPKKLWQRNYYERVIRNDDELNSIREYIQTNPARWAIDSENPEV